jgi:hypothetical protein
VKLLGDGGHGLFSSDSRLRAPGSGPCSGSHTFRPMAAAG